MKCLAQGRLTGVAGAPTQSSDLRVIGFRIELVSLAGRSLAC
ncbi:hypothetical protein ACWGLP_04350 [Streptomyces lydicus]